MGVESTLLCELNNVALAEEVLWGGTLGSLWCADRAAPYVQQAFQRC